MAKRVNWSKGEYLLTLGLYLKIPYLNGVVPTPQDVVQLISDKFGVNRTVDSIKMRLNNFMSCDPLKQEQGIKGLDSGKQYCMPYWEKWHGDINGLNEEISKILSSNNHVEAPSLELISILDENPSWSKLELTVLIHLALTRVPADINNPLVKFFSSWFEKSIDDVVELLVYFTQLFHHSFQTNTDRLNRIAEDFFTEYSANKSAFQFAGHLYWESALEKSIEIFSELKESEVLPIIDTVEVEDPISKLVEELTLQGASRITIIQEAMRKFPEKPLSLSEWSDEICKHLDKISTSQDDAPQVVAKPIVSTKPDNKPQKRTKPRLKFRSITIEGQTIEESNPTQMFVEFIELIGADSIYEMQIPYRGVTLVDTKPTPGYENSSKPVGNGYYVGTNNSTQDKISIMQDIADYFSMELHIDRYYKSKDD